MKQYYYVEVKFLDEISLFSGYHKIISEKVYANSFKEARSKVEETYKGHKIQILNP